MLTTRIKQCIYKVSQFPVIYHILRRRRKGAVTLFYHGVEDKIVDPRVQTLHLPFEQFEKQIRYLRKNFEIVSLDYLYECLSNDYKASPSLVAITFDDGYKNNLNIVAPFLKAQDIPFAVFISTKHINDRIRFPTYYLRTSIFYTDQRYMDISTLSKKIDISTESKKIFALRTISEKLKTAPQNIVNLIIEDLIQLISSEKWLEINSYFSSDAPMNWNEVKQLPDFGGTIGSHCHDHAILHSNQSREEIGYQLKISKDLIENFLGQCKYFAYPNGSINDICSDAMLKVKDNNYLLGFTTVSGEIITGQSNLCILPRIGAPADLDEFKFSLNASFRGNSDY